jgi:hypothetical protein
MALAQSMKNFVNDLKASRRSRHEFVRGNREIAKNIMADNRQFLQNIREQNKINAEQTHAFLQSAKETRVEDFKRAKEASRQTRERVHQAVDAIRQGAKGLIKELQEDTQKAHEYWASLDTDDPIGEPKVVKTPREIKAEAEATEAKQETEDITMDVNGEETLKRTAKDDMEEKGEKVEKVEKTDKKTDRADTSSVR